MRTILSDPTLQSELMQKGFTKVPLLSQAEVDYIRNELQYLRPHDNFSPDGKGTTSSTYHCSFLDTNVDYKRKAGDLISKVFSPHIRHLLVGYEILNSNFYVKPPGTGVFQIHQNWPVIDINDTTITVWCPLSDTNEQNGTLQVVEGSHKLVPDISGPWGNPFFKNFEEELIEEYLKPISCTAGEAVVFDDSLIHWSSRNSSDSPRVAIQILCVPTDRTPVFYYLDQNAPEKGFEVFKIDSEFFMERTITDILKRPKDVKSLGFVRNTNLFLTVGEFAEKLKHGDEIRQRIYSSWDSGSVDTFANVVSDVPFDDKVRSSHFQERGYTIEPFLDTADIRTLSKLHRETTPSAPADYFASAFGSDPDTRRKVFEGITAIVKDKVKRLVPGYRIHRAIFVTKNAKSLQGRVGLHQDYTFVDHTQGWGLSLWCPLDDVDNRNACLRVVEGSHVFREICPTPFEPSTYRDVYGELESSYITKVPMTAGSAFLFDSCLLHGTNENQTELDRTSILLNLVPENMTPRLYQRSRRQPGKLAVYEINSDFRLLFPPNQYIEDPEQFGAKLVGLIDHKYEILTSADLARRLPVRNPPIAQGPSEQPGRSLKKIGRRALLLLSQSRLPDGVKSSLRSWAMKTFKVASQFRKTCL